MASTPKIIYLDNHATTPVDPRVAEQVVYWMTTAYGNASSRHAYGDEAARAVEVARTQVASLVNVDAANVVFTSGATESINLAIKGFCHALRPKRLPVRIGLTMVEHHAVFETCQELERTGAAKLTWIPVDGCGRIAIDVVERACQSGLDLLCVMAANNEIGNLYPVAEIGKLAERYNVAFFCDACQAAGKVPIDFEESRMCFLSLSAHKMYGPKGVGALVVRDKALIRPMFHGGGQEAGLRPGTLNVPGIVGLGLACQLRAQEMLRDEEVIRSRRDRLQQILMENVPDLRVNGDSEHKLAGTLHISLKTVEADAVIARTRDRLAISTGSACSSGAEGPSHVLRAIGLTDDWINGSLRFCVGKFNSETEIEEAVALLCAVIAQVRALM